jgi:ribonuclease R
LAKSSKPPARRPSALPDRAAIEAFIAQEGGTAGKREIARAFGIKGADRMALKAALREMRDEGLLARKDRVHVPGHLHETTLAEIIGRDADGELIAEPVEWDRETQGDPPKIVIDLPRRTRPELVPGLKDRVLLRISERGEGAEPAHAGRIIKVVGKAADRVLGVLRIGTDGRGRLVPVDKKNATKELDIAPGDIGQARSGDLVSVDILRGGRWGTPQARVRERLGRVDTEQAISLIAIHAHGLPHVFSQAALAQAEDARPATAKGREDWTKLPLLTIDPSDAKDHDDAVHAEPDADPDNQGGFIVTVAIADVAAYVTPGSALDREALERGNSVYFPDRVVPMLPERISNDLCSLRPREKRPALAFRLVIGSDGRKLRHSLHRVLMRSAAKLSYQQAQAAIDGRADDITGPLLEPVLRPLWAAYACVKQARDKRAPLDLDLPERKILLKPDGTVDRVIVPQRLDAHRLIEEFMILANVAAAEELEKHRQVLIYRVHDAPSPEKLVALREFLATFDISIPKADNLRPANFNGILARVRGSEHETLVNEVVLRSQSQAEYAAENYGHFGLNLRRYAHFTSPIRRYADLIVHRALIACARLGRDGLPPEQDLRELAEIAARISAAERRAMAAERETVDRLIAHHLAGRVGESFEGRIAGVTRAGLFVKLAGTGADGFIPVSTLGREYFAFDEVARAMVGNRTGATFRLGDDVTVRLAEAAPVAGALRFEMLSDGRAGEPVWRVEDTRQMVRRPRRGGAPKLPRPKHKAKKGGGGKGRDGKGSRR